MEKKISVSELFELIRKGEQPEEINCNGTSAVWDKKEFCYRGRRNGTIILAALSKRVSGYPVTYEEPILDKAERKYLSDVIRPFRSRIKAIQKMQDDVNKCEYIRLTAQYKGIRDYSMLPSFKAGHMYKGMELRKYYSLEELGL